MKKFLLPALALILAATPSLFAQTPATSSPPVPEEARKHFVMGTTLFKDAKTPGDFVLVVSQFKQAADLAPQWPDARYNLALAKEAAGDFSAAMADLKIYQQFKLSDTEARTAQDKIYALEAKQEKKAAEQKASDDANRPAAQLAKLVQSLDGGVWRCVSSTWDDAVRGHVVGDMVGRYYIAVSGHNISGSRSDHYDPDVSPDWTVTLTSRRFSFDASRPSSSPHFYPYGGEVTISDDGRSITEQISGSLHDNVRGYPFTITRTYDRIR
jgi:hypothetical protein